jgi:hypothetical protein
MLWSRILDTAGNITLWVVLCCLRAGREHVDSSNSLFGIFLLQGVLLTETRVSFDITKLPRARQRFKLTLCIVDETAISRPPNLKGFPAKALNTDSRAIFQQFRQSSHAP